MASTGTHVISASGASLIATLATHPFDVIKVCFSSLCDYLRSLIGSGQTKMQVRTEQRFHSFFQTVTSTLQQRGAMGFFSSHVMIEERVGCFETRADEDSLLLKSKVWLSNGLYASEGVTDPCFSSKPLSKYCTSYNQNPW